MVGCGQPNYYLKHPLIGVLNMNFIFYYREKYREKYRIEKNIKSLFVVEHRVSASLSLLFQI